MTRNCLNCIWLAGTGLLIFAGKPIENVTLKDLTKHIACFFTRFTSVFLICAQSTKHTAQMCGGIMTLEHNVWTMLRLAYHGCKILRTRAKCVE